MHIWVKMQCKPWRRRRWKRCHRLTHSLRDVLIVVFIKDVTSIVWGIIIFSYLGNMVDTMNLSFADLQSEFKGNNINSDKLWKVFLLVRILQLLQGAGSTEKSRRRDGKRKIERKMMIKNEMVFYQNNNVVGIAMVRKPGERLRKVFFSVSTGLNNIVILTHGVSSIRRSSFWSILIFFSLTLWCFNPMVSPTRLLIHTVRQTITSIPIRHLLCTHV